MGSSAESRDQKKNVDFVQISRKNMAALRKMALENPTAMSLFMFLSQYMDYSGAVICSQTVLQEALNKSRKSIYSAIKYLRENNFIEVLKSGTANVYALNYEVVWSSWNTSKKYAAFKGNILLSKTENQDFEDRLKKIRRNEIELKEK